MVNNVAGECHLGNRFAMLLKALVVRSTTQKDESLSDIAGRFLQISFQLRRSEMSYYLLHGTDKMIAIAVEGIVAHGQG
jgi:hypothetical protein